MMTASTFKLKNGTMAISQNNRTKVILIPPDACVVVLGEDTENDSLIKIHYQDDVLLVRPEDFRCGIGLMFETSAL